MKVGILSSFYPEIQGGAEVGLAVLIDGLRSTGLEQVLLTLSKAKPEVGIRTVPIGHFALVPKRIKLFGLPGLNSILCNRLTELLRENNVDLIHVNDTYSLCAATRAAESLRIPLVLSYHNNLNIPYSSYGYPYPLSSWMDARERGILKAAKKSSTVIATSNYIAKRLIKAGFPSASVKPIYIGGAVCNWGSPRIQFDHRHIRVLSVGVVQYQKGLQELLLAIKKLAVDNVLLDVVVVGRGPYLNKLLRLAAHLSVLNQVKFAGRVDAQELTRLYDWCDTVVVPTITPEPFGRVAVEAMSRGRPVIGTDTGGLTEIIEDGETGYLVPPRDPSRIAEKILLFQNQPDLLAEMGRRALDKCKAVFDQRLIARQVLDVYQHLCSNA